MRISPRLGNPHHSVQHGADLLRGLAHGASPMGRAMERKAGLGLALTQTQTRT